MKSNVYAPLAALGLAATLAACSTDQATHSAAALPKAPTSAGAPVTSAAPPAAPPVAPSQTARPVPAAANASPAHARPARAASPAPARPPQWVRRPSLTAASYPAARSAAPAPAAADLTLAPQPEATDSSLPAFLAGIAPAGQVFTVQAGRDTILVGQQGTRIVVPAYAFDVPAASGPVQLTLREFYATPDIVLAGLGTRADQGVLETGGMLYLYAAAGGQTVHLRPGKQLLLQLPTRQLLPGMRLYEGVSAEASHAPDWRLAGTGSALVPDNPLANRAALDEWVKLHPPKSPRWPEFAKSEKAMLKEYARLMPDSKAEQAYLRRKRTIGKDEQRMLKGLSRANHAAIRHAVTFAVQLDSAGNLQEATRLTGDSVLAAGVLAALRQLPAQRPGSFVSTLPRGRRTVSATHGYFSVLYARSGRKLVGFQWVLLDKQLQEELAKAAARSRAEFAKGFGGASTPLALDGGLYYELAAGGLGWINCDRLLEPGPRIQFAVNTPDTGTVVSLVFKGQRSILASSRTEGSTAVFEQVPGGAAATVVALRREKGITYLATSGVSLGQAALPALDFRPVSLEQLRRELAQL